MNNSFVLREAKAEDLEQLLQLLHQLSKKTEEDEKAERAKLEETLKRMVADGNYFTCVFEEGGKVLGTGLLLVQLNLAHGGRPYGHIENIVVDENHRKEGIGMRVVEWLVERAREKGCYKVILDCSRENMPFYEVIGLEEHGIEMRLDL